MIIQKKIDTDDSNYKKEKNKVIFLNLQSNFIIVASTRSHLF